MGTQEPSAEELQAQLEEQQNETQEQIDSAGENAKEKAEKQGLSEAEVNRRVEAARKEEKEKLYPQIKALKDAVDELKGIVKKEQDEKDQIRKDAQKAEEEKRLATLSSEERQTEALTRIEEQLREEREARLASEAAFADQQRQAALREYRRNAIQAAEDAGEFLLPELVQGNSEAEIDASITTAKTRYAEIAEKFKSEQGKKTRQGMPRPTSPSTEAFEDQELDEQLTAVDQDKYLKDPAYRAKIQASLAEAYARSQQ